MIYKIPRSKLDLSLLIILVKILITHQHVCIKSVKPKPNKKTIQKTEWQNKQKKNGETYNPSRKVSAQFMIASNQRCGQTWRKVVTQGHDHFPSRFLRQFAVHKGEVIGRKVVFSRRFFSSRNIMFIVCLSLKIIKLFNSPTSQLRHWPPN